MPAPEAGVEHLLEVRLRRRRSLEDAGSAGEVEVVEALDELVLRELVDVLLEREIDHPPAVGDLRRPRDRPDLLPLHPLAQPRLDVGVLEVEEVPGVVPDEAVLVDRLAVAADLAVGFEDRCSVLPKAAAARPLMPAPMMSDERIPWRQLCSEVEAPASEPCSRAARSANPPREGPPRFRLANPPSPARSPAPLRFQQGGREAPAPSRSGAGVAHLQGRATALTSRTALVRDNCKMDPRKELTTSVASGVRSPRRWESSPGCGSQIWGGVVRANAFSKLSGNLPESSS